MQNQNQEQNRQEQAQSSQSKNSCLLIGLLLLALAALAWYTLARGVGGTGGAPSYSPRSQAYVMAQQLEAHRQQMPTAKNYCEAQLYYHTASGVYSGPSQIKDGFGIYPTHCEQTLLQWVSQTALPSISAQDYARIVTIDVVVFSQVRVCVDCKPTFPTWENRLRQQVAQARESAKLNLYVFDIRPGSPSGFAPGTFRAGPFSPPYQGTQPPVPVRTQDIRQVYPVKS